MKKNILNLIVIIAVVCFLGCASSSGPSSSGQSSSRAPSNEFVALNNLVFPEIMYYGANLGHFPPEAREFIMNTQFTKERMEQPSMLNPSLKVWWSDDNNSVRMEASYTVAPGYVGAGTTKTWGQGANYSGSSDINKIYGRYAYYQTLRFKYEYSLYSQNLLKTDRAYAEIIAFAKQLSAEIEYDYSVYPQFRNIVKPTPGLRRAVCDGYANEVMEKALRLSSVRSVERWTGPNHAWNVLKLTDGRTLYFDLTWFDNEHINEVTGVIYQTDDYGWNNITFYEHLFRFSGVALGTTQFTHNLGKFESEIRK